MADSVADRIVGAAERLIAKRGLDAVSLRAVNRAAGAKNASAIQYHFKNRAGLVRAILEKHEVSVERRRHELLDDYVARDVQDVRAIASALVVPLAAELTTNGGTGYLQLICDLYNRPDPNFDPAIIADEHSSMGRWRLLVVPLLSPEAVRLHRRFDALRFTASELARRGRTGRRDHQLFVSQLVDLVTALLSAPVSDVTRDLLRA